MARTITGILTVGEAWFGHRFAEEKWVCGNCNKSYADLAYYDDRGKQWILKECTSASQSQSKVDC